MNWKLIHKTIQTPICKVIVLDVPEFLSQLYSVKI